MPDWLTTTWGKALGAIGIYGTLVGLGLLPLPAALLALAIGALTGNLTLALAVALVLSLAVNVLLVVQLRRRRSRRHGHRLPLPPKAYAVEGELDSILLTSADLEAWWANMLSAARQRVGPDARAYVEAIHLDSPFIVFRGESPAALKNFSGTVSGPDASHVSWYGVHRKERSWKSDPQPPLWRTDDTWRDLLTRAWLQERPVRTFAVLYERTSGPRRYWEIAFGTYLTDDERIVGERMYTMQDGQLVRRER